MYVGTRLVRGIIQSGNSAAVHRLNLSVVAEGVETQGQLDFLMAHHFETVQGYLYQSAATGGRRAGNVATRL